MRNRLKHILSETLHPQDLVQVSNSYDIVGDIAIMRSERQSGKRCQTVAEAIMQIHKNVKTVLLQTSPVCGDLRLRQLNYVADENKTATTHVESKCRFKVDVERCYFSPRLSYERKRVSKLVRPKEVVVNMFAGVGCFSLIIAKYSTASKVYSIDVNLVALQFMEENVRMNKVYGRVIPILGDAKEVIEKRLSNVADRILMPLPHRALGYLPSALSTLKGSGGCIHYYDFEHATRNENPIEKVKLRLARRLENMDATFEIPFSRIVRSVGPH